MNVKVDGAELHCTAHGTGPVCLVLTGIGTRPYERQTAALTRRLSLVYVDLRGSGRSSGEASDLTLERVAEDLEAVRTQLRTERVAVFGHSVLGVLAIEYGRRRPSSVSHVIAVGTPPSGNMAVLAAKAKVFFEQDASDERKRVLRENLAALPPDAPLGQVFMAQTPLRFFDPRADAAPLFEGAEHRPAFLAHSLGPLTGSWDVREDTGAPSVPTFLALGRYDYIVPHVLWDGVVDELPAFKRHLFERSGHQPFVEEPERFEETLGAWMGLR